jgi:hypothetical protein
MFGPWVPDSVGVTVQTAPDSGVLPVPAYAGPLLTTSALARGAKANGLRSVRAAIAARKDRLRTDVGTAGNGMVSTAEFSQID